MTINRVFVYGTLMTSMTNHHRIKPFIKAVLPAKSIGLLYHLPYGYPAMVPGNRQVQGEVIELTDITQGLKVLDDLEGYQGPGYCCNLYNRVVQEVEQETGERLLAYVYLWAKPAELKILGTPVPGGDWRKYIK